MVPSKILLDECVEQARIPLFPDCFKKEVSRDYMTDKYSRRYM